jgi:hypothetical protein
MTKAEPALNGPVCKSQETPKEQASISGMEERRLCHSVI